MYLSAMKGFESQRIGVELRGETARATTSKMVSAFYVYHPRFQLLGSFSLDWDQSMMFSDPLLLAPKKRHEEAVID